MNMAYTPEDFASDLRESIKDWRNPRTPPAVHREIVEWWSEHGIKNQFQAAMKISEIERNRPAAEEMNR